MCDINSRGVTSNNIFVFVDLLIFFDFGDMLNWLRKRVACFEPS